MLVQSYIFRLGEPLRLTSFASRRAIRSITFGARRALRALVSAFGGSATIPLAKTQMIKLTKF